MAMKNVNLGLFFLGEDEGDDFLEAEQTREENGSAVDDESNGEANQPIDIQLLDKEGDDNDACHEKDDMEPIAPTHLNLEDALGEEILQESRDRLHAETGTGGTYGKEARNDDEIQQDIDDHARCCHKVELLEAAIGGEQGAEDVCR